MKALAAATLCLAYALKRYYSNASAEDLRWVLRPTTGLTSLILQREFVFQPGEGYLSRELSILISPACAGVNFLIIAFVSLALGFGGRFGSRSMQAAFLLAAAGLAYAATLVVNAFRIALSVGLAHSAAGGLGVSFQGAHRVLGVAVYLGGLLALCLAVDIWLGSRGTRPGWQRRAVLLLALGCYAAVTLLVPLLGGAARLPEYWNHAALVAGAVTGLAALVFAARGRSWDDGHHEFRPSEQLQRGTHQQGPAG